LDKEGFDSSISPEMIRIIDHQGIKVNSVAVASGVPGDASIDQMIIWAVSDQFSYDQKGKAVYGGSIDISSGEPHILWQPLDFYADKVSLFSPSTALSLNSQGQVFASIL
jgi:hypothetical protein